LNQRVGMVDSLAGVALAAGAGTRLRPLTYLRPKPLCPLGDQTLLDFALATLATVVPGVAVNAHHGADGIKAHLDQLAVGMAPGLPSEVHLSHERSQALGTAGALVHMRRWLAGRDALVVNADTWHGADLRAFVESWDGRSASVLTTTPGAFGPGSTVVASLVPAEALARMPQGTSGLWEVLWRQEVAEGRLVARRTTAEFHDCGTPASYLAANLAWASGPGARSPVATSHPGSVVGEGAVVEGRLEGSVVWPGATVGPTEYLRHAIRADGTTVLVR
jgi:MurNAc alpha-1-phosphate uridylyltransferase